MMKQNWNETIRKKMEGHEVRVPDELWYNVMRGVADQRRKRMHIRRIAYAVSSCAAVAAMLVLFLKFDYDNDARTVGIITHVNSGVRDNTKQTIPEYADKQQLEKAIRKEHGDEQLVRNSINGLKNYSVKKLVISTLKKSTSLVAVSGSISSNNNGTCRNVHVETGLSNVNASHEKETVSNTEEKCTNVADRHESKRYRELMNADNNSACHVNDKYITDNCMYNNRIVFGFSVQNLMSSASGLGNSCVNNLNLSHDFVTNNYANVTNAIGMYAARMETTKAHHKNPLRASVSIAFPLVRHVYIESGLMYSYHSSDIQYVNNSYETDCKQYLHYIGIPLNLLYRIADYRRLNVYVVGGGAVEKMVYGRQKIFDETYKLSIDPLQFSVHLGGGVEYKLSDHVGIYVEPNINCYFKNNISTATIYQDKPWTPDFKIGLRLSK